MRTRVARGDREAAQQASSVVRARDLQACLPACLHAGAHTHACAWHVTAPVPVEQREALVQRGAQLADPVAEQLRLDGRERVEHRLVRPEHGVERLDVGVVLVLLQRHVERRLRDGEAHPVEVLGLADEDDEVLPN